MSIPPSPLNPSQAVERIREIIVGRHLERLEDRLSRLESSAGQSVSSPHAEDRMIATEARLEALQDHFHRFTDANRESNGPFGNREEAQRLAAHIQEVAVARAVEAAAPAINQLERKLGTWLTDWQSAFHRYLEDRDARIATQLRGELAALWENTESQMTRLESRTVDRDSIEKRLGRIAIAARALAEAASPDTDPAYSPR